MSRLSKMREIARGMGAARQARERERWPRERMAQHHGDAVDALVRAAAARSPFYRERFADAVGSGRVELSALPPLGKQELMANLDAALCEPRLRGLDLRAHLGREGLVLGEHRVMASSGSTGTPSLYVYSRDDWAGVLALFFRYNEMIGLRPRLPRLRVAAIGAPTLASMTQQIATSADVGVHRVLRLRTADSVPDLVAALNAFEPDALNVYPSVGAVLADEQIAGRLTIRPRIVSTSSELRTPEMAARMSEAWGVHPFDLYGASEGLWGVECEHHTGIHLFEDWCVVENVDGDGNAVPDGEPGERLLVTNLFNRTLPMIRFAVSDAVVIDRGPCACGRTLPRLREVRGRSEDVLSLPGAGRSVPVHPTQFSLVAADPGVREFQVVQRGERVLLRLVLRERADAGCADRVAGAVREKLAALGVVDPAVEAETVPELARTPAGKLKLVVVQDAAPAVQ